MKSINVPAATDELQTVIDFINEELEQYDCPMKAQFQLEMAIEEIFVNIANYAYNPTIGEATVQCEVGGDPLSITIWFLDGGKPFDPLKKEDADTSVEALEEREGGLGIYMVKNTMDAVDYVYKDGKNILTIRKNIEEE